jgi:predicted TIM-barrel fold metal-dependent hydrolase
VFAQYPQVKFEIYHAGHPWVRETGMVAKACPNVWLNLCWSHSLSGRMTRSGLDEWLDLVPANKIIAYGGDTHLWVEWSVGDLVQARENVASVLARRINDGLLKEEQAIDLARLMFYENPADLYGLGRPGLDDFSYE